VGFKSHVTHVYSDFILSLDLCLLYATKDFFVNTLICSTHKYKNLINFFHNNFSTKKYQISNLKLKLLILILVLKLILIITRIKFILVLNQKSSLKEGRRRVFLVDFSTLFLDVLLHFCATKILFVVGPLFCPVREYKNLINIF